MRYIAHEMRNHCIILNNLIHRKWSPFPKGKASRMPTFRWDIVGGTGVLDCPQQKNFGRDIVFSADLCYNGTNEEPPSEREVARRSRDGRSLRDFKH